MFGMGEIGLILGIILLILIIMYGPQKTIDWARSLGQAKNEYDKAKKGEIESEEQ